MRWAIKKCECCGKEFNAYNSLTKFCSVGCGISFQKKFRKWNWKKESVQKVSGKNNHNFRNGDRTNGTKRTWIGNKEFWRNRDIIINKMLEEKGYVYCEHCGRSDGQYEGHHLVYRSEKPFHEQLHQVPNIIILCKKCHSKFHDNKSIRNDIVLSRKLNILFGDDILNK